MKTFVDLSNPNAKEWLDNVRREAHAEGFRAGERQGQQELQRWIASAYDEGFSDGALHVDILRAERDFLRQLLDRLTDPDKATREEAQQELQNQLESTSG